MNDAAIITLNAKIWDVIKVERDSETAGKTIYYRTVVDN